MSGSCMPPAGGVVANAALQAIGLSVAQGGVTILHNLHLALPRARWISIAGPNGAGKSTLLKALAGLLPHTGEVLLDGRPLGQWSHKTRARQLAWLGQNETSTDDLIAWDVAMMGRLPHQPWLHPPSPTDWAAAERALRATQVWGLRERALGQLSGGERQRVLLARALAVESEVLLLDEPLVNLDPPHQADWLALVQALVAQGKTVVSVLHEVSMALHADELVVMDGGRVCHQGGCADVATHRALEAVFERRIAIYALQDQWVALPKARS